ncbi:2136_t:CDS:2, partial [Ambispora gerdemannii]
SESKNVENEIRRNGDFFSEDNKKSDSGSESEISFTENKLRFISDDDETTITYNIAINNKQIEIIVANNIIQVWAKTEKSKTLLNIWSIPSTFSKYLKDPIISIKREDSSVKNDEFKIKLKSQNKNQILEHSIKIEPHAKSILGMASALELILKQIQEFEKAEKSKNMNDDAKIKNKYAELKNLHLHIKQVAPVIIEKAVIEKENFRILDVRFRIMATMMKADLITVVRKMLIDPNLRLHIPEKAMRYQNNEMKYNFVLFLFPKPRIDKEHRSTLMIASDYYQHKLVESLLEYYSANAKSNVGWMETVTQALPELITKYPKLVNELLKNKIFYQNEIPLDKSWKFYRPTENSSVRAFDCEFNLFISFRQEQLEQLEKEKQTYSSKYRKTNMKYYQVPLPRVMMPSFEIQSIDSDSNGLYNYLLKLILLERNRGYRSPFFYLVTNDKTGEIFDNPSIEAIINFQWHRSKSVIADQLLMPFIHGITFVLQVYTYLNRIVYGAASVGTTSSWLMCAYSYLHFTEKIRRKRYIHRSQPLTWILYLFELIGTILPLFGSAWMLWVNYSYAGLLLSDYKSKESRYCQLYNKQCQAEVIIYSFAALFLWIVIFLQMRVLPAIGKSLLLHFAPGLGVFPNSSTFTGNFTTINPNNQTAPNFNLTQDLDWTDSSDNYYYRLDKAIEAVYFWISGRWDQIENWNFWPVDLVTVLGSLFLATLMQNLLIGLMGKALDETVLVRRALIQTRAHLIANSPDEFLVSYIYYSVPGEKLNKRIQEEISDESREEKQLKNIEYIEKQENTKAELVHIKDRMEGLETTLSEILRILKK